MLSSEHFSLVNKVGDKTEFTITRVHCRIENGNESPNCEVTTNITEIQMVDFSKWLKELNQQ